MIASTSRSHCCLSPDVQNGCSVHVTTHCSEASRRFLRETDERMSRTRGGRVADRCRRAYDTWRILGSRTKRNAPVHELVDDADESRVASRRHRRPSIRHADGRERFGGDDIILARVRDDVARDERRLVAAAVAADDARAAAALDFRAERERVADRRGPRYRRRRYRRDGLARAGRGRHRVPSRRRRHLRARGEGEGVGVGGGRGVHARGREARVVPPVVTARGRRGDDGGDEERIVEEFALDVSVFAEHDASILLLLLLLLLLRRRRRRRRRRARRRRRRLVRDDEEGVFEEFALDVSVFAEHDAFFSRARRRRRRRRLLRRPRRRRPRGLRRGDERLRREVRERNRRAVEEVAQGLVLLRARGVERELLTPRRRGLLFFASRSVSARSTNLRARSHARGTQRGRERERHDRRDALADEDEEEEERDGCRRVRALARSARRGRGKAKYLAVRFAKSA